MKASRFERELAQTNGVVIRTWAQPIAIEGHGGDGRAACCSSDTREQDGKLVGAGRRLPHRGRHGVHRHRPARAAEATSTARRSNCEGGRIVVDAERRTSLPGVWAGGDCVLGGAGPDGRRGRGRQAGGALDRSRALKRLELKEHDHGRPRAAISSASSRPTRSGSPRRRRPTQGQRRARLPRRLGRRGVEDAGRGGPADRQRLRPALRRDPRARPPR